MLGVDLQGVAVGIALVFSCVVCLWQTWAWRRMDEDDAQRERDRAERRIGDVR